jgi:hypothetical protein
VIRSFLILAAGILAVACSACVQAPPPPPIAGYVAGATCATDVPPQPFLTHVKFLSSTYDPSNNYSSAPTGINPAPIDPATSRYATALQNAFLLAPPSFQLRLCGLTGIYVNGPDTCNDTDCFNASWGYRAKDGSTYVAITAGLWNLQCPDGSSPYIYHCFETDLLKTTVNWDLKKFNNFTPPQYGSAKAADNFDMTILAALAHEVGHVRWYEVLNPNKSNWGKNYDPNKLCGNSFFASWYSGVNKPPKWRGFGGRKQNNGLPDIHLSDPQIGTIDRAKGQDPSYALTYLDWLYQSTQPWASFFGSITPDEDFVETYKLWILTNVQANQIQGEGPLTDLPISFRSGSTRNIPQDYGMPDPTNYGAPSTTNKSVLSAKAKCIGRYVI